MTRRTIPLILTFAVLAALAGPLAAADGDKLHGNLLLRMTDALGRDTGHRADIVLEIPIRNGQWAEEFWGCSHGFNRGWHQGKVIASEIDGDTRKLTVTVDVAPDSWIRGGTATYRINLTRDGEIFRGSYEGVFTIGGDLLTLPRPKPTGEPKSDTAKIMQKLMKKQQKKENERKEEEKATAIKVAGKVSGKMTIAWPGERKKGFEAPQPGEHPRLAMRKSDLKRFRKLAKETETGKAMLARALKMAGAGINAQHDKFSNWPAAGLGFAYLMTGNKDYARQARDLIDRTMFSNRAGRGGIGIGQDIHHGPRLQGLAIAYDLCHDGWDEEFRAKVVGEIQQRIHECRTGRFGRGRMSGFNPNPWSNHNGVRMSAVGLGALAIIGEKNADGEVMEEAAFYADQAAYEIRGYLEMGLGRSGWGMEGAFYKVMTLQRGVAHFLPAYENCTGRKIDAGEIGDFMMTGYFMEAQPGKVPNLDPVLWSAGIYTVPDDMMPGVKYLYDRTVGVKGNKTFGIEHGLLAPFAFAMYPWDVEEAKPAESFRWCAPDPTKGHYIFRPEWKDSGDILMVTNLKANIFGGCHHERSGKQSELHLQGFGKQWLSGQYLIEVPLDSAFNDRRGAKILSSRNSYEDRTCVVDMDMSEVYMSKIDKKQRGKVDLTPEQSIVRPECWGPMLDYGIDARRTMAVDASGVSGADLLVVLVDQVTLPKSLSGKKTRWSLPLKGGAKVSGNSFMTGDAEGANLTGVLVAGGPLENDVEAEGDGTYFVVFTLQNGQAPEIRVEGEGLDAKVTVGKRTVRYADGTVILE